MKQLVGEKLKQLGLDVEFLAWLEGEAERLPHLDRVRKLKGEDFAGALRAVAWLGQLFSEPEVILPSTPEEWLARYDLLEAFLREALSWSMAYHMASIAEDLETLEKVLEELLPASSRRPYQQDMRHLRQRGQPPRLSDIRAKPSGGKGASEQTWRMRAAVKYVSKFSKTPYLDLADFWNERLGTVKYHPDEIKSRLRKGDPMSKGPGAAERVFQFWRRIYRGDLRDVFPGPFPLSDALSERLERIASDKNC